VQDRPHNVFACFPISSQCYSQDCFALDPNHPDFAATGLTRACHIICTKFYDFQEGQFTLEGRQQLKGELQGELLADFRAFAGV
jgi:hypothetical protein